MTTTSRVMITRRSRRDLAQALAAREEAAHHMYDAELALHVAHQARVGEWVMRPTSACTRRSPNTRRRAPTSSLHGDTRAMNR